MDARKAPEINMDKYSVDSAKVAEAIIQRLLVGRALPNDRQS